MKEIPMPAPLIPADLLARTQIINGLRQLADYLQDHPGVPINEYGWDLHAFAITDNDLAGRADVDKIASALGVQARDDTADGGHYTASKTFGRITYEFIHVTARRRAAHQALMSYAGAITTDAGTPVAGDSPEAA
jgi:hypothetical protein